MKKMNKKMFEKLLPITSIESGDVLNTAMTTPDIVGGVLRLHLLSEQILDAWVCSACNREEIFESGFIAFNTKQKLAENLQIPSVVSKLLEAINKIRNYFAHDVSATQAPINKMESLKSLLKNFVSDPDVILYIEDPANYGIQLNDETGTTTLQIKYTNAKTDLEFLAITLALIVFYLIQKVTKSS